MQIMLERTLEEFSLDTEKLVIGAITNDDFVKIKTNNGNAVLISEAEWNILRDVVQTALHMVLHKH